MVDEREVLRRAHQEVGTGPLNSFWYGAYEMSLEKAKETARREIAHPEPNLIKEN